MQADHIAQMLVPVYGAWQCGRNLMRLSEAPVLYGAPQQDDQSARTPGEQVLAKGMTSGAGFLVFLFLVIFITIIPAKTILFVLFASIFVIGLSRYALNNIPVACPWSHVP